MRGCPDMEGRLLEYSDLTVEEQRRVDAHLTSCPACRAWVEDLKRVDADLSAAFAAVRLPPEFEAGVLRAARRERLWRRPSPLPEILDFIGWAAVITVVTSLAVRYLRI